MIVVTGIQNVVVSPLPGSSDKKGNDATSTTLGTAAPQPFFCTLGVTLAACAINHIPTAAAIHRLPRRVLRIERFVLCAFPHSGHTTGPRETSLSTPVRSYQHLRQRRFARPRNPARSQNNPRSSNTTAITNNNQYKKFHNINPIYPPSHHADPHSHV